MLNIKNVVALLWILSSLFFGIKMYFFQAGMAAGQADVERGGGEDEMGWCSFYFLMRYFQREKERIKRDF